MSEVVITVKKDGNIQIEVENVIGSSCVDKTLMLEDIINSVDSPNRDYKPEYDQNVQLNQRA